MKKNYISLEFHHQDHVHKLTGLQLINIEANNFFIYSNSITNSSSHNNNLKNLYVIDLNGVFFANNEQLLMQHIAFSDRCFSGLIKHNNFLIEAIFNIQKYQILHDLNELDYFNLKLSCQREWKHTLIRND